MTAISMPSAKTAADRPAAGHGRRIRIGRIAAWAVLWIFVLLTLFPFYWMLRTSLSNNRMLFSEPSSWLPVAPTLGGYERVFGLATIQEAQAQGGSGASISFWLYLRNSLVVATAVTTLIATAVAAPPVVRVQAALHPWVAYAILPLFALANAGVSLGGVDLGAGGSMWVILGVTAALVIGKPVGVISASWLAVRLGWCRLPAGVSWSGVVLIGLLAGIGFTMSIFISNLAFADAELLGAAKLGVLAASLIAGVFGLIVGAATFKSSARGT